MVPTWMWVSLVALAVVAIVWVVASRLGAAARSRRAELAASAALFERETDQNLRNMTISSGDPAEARSSASGMAEPSCVPLSAQELSRLTEVAKRETRDKR